MPKLRRNQSQKRYLIRLGQTLRADTARNREHEHDFIIASTLLHSAPPGLYCGAFIMSPIEDVAALWCLKTWSRLYVRESADRMRWDNALTTSAAVSIFTKYLKGWLPGQPRTLVSCVPSCALRSEYIEAGVTTPTQSSQANGRAFAIAIECLFSIAVPNHMFVYSFYHQ
jgi:hypothetical protein